MKIAWIECAAGASGDMFLGAWLDLGVDEDQWLRHLHNLGVKKFELVTQRVKRNGIAAVKVTMHAEPEKHHRHLQDIERIIEASELPQIVKTKSKEAFWHLAEAEAAVHGTTPERIHFHEVGALDAIVDIVGSMIAWHMIGEPLCIVSAIEVGGGSVECEHGMMQVPAPATVRLLQGYPTYSSGSIGETTTPTGAAIIRTLATPAPKRPFIGRSVGYGAGTKDLPIANVLRIQQGEWADTALAVGRDGELAIPVSTGAVMVETNVDDMNPELAPYVIERLLAVGAMDAGWMPLTMKKGRPAVQLRVLCSEERLTVIARAIFRETSTIGLRYYRVEKLMLPHRIVDVSTSYGAVPVKFAEMDEQIVNASPEYEACRRLALEQGVSLKLIYQAALAAIEREIQQNSVAQEL